MILLIVTTFLCGLWRGGIVMQKVNIYNAFYKKQVTIKATALDDAVYSERGQLEFTVEDVLLVDPEETQLVGEIDIEGFGVPMVYRGDQLEIEGRLYKKRGGQIAGISFGQIRLVSRSKTVVDTIRREFSAGMQNSLPEPLASFGMGLLIGQRATLDREFQEQLIAVGLIHIVAVSGYNLTIIMDGVRRVFRRRSRYQTLLFSLSLIGIFLLLTGNSPSIVRAALVSSLSLIAWFFGRRFKPLLLLTLVASITAGINPLNLWSNVGWYLSFMAFFGVLVVAPLMKARFISSHNQDKLLPTILTETIAAQACTLPIILFIFSRLSIVGILANLLVVPFVPLAMLTSLIAGVAGTLQLAISRILSLPAKIILEYILSVAQLLSKFPYANIELHIRLYQMMILYGMIVGILILIWTKQSKNKFDTITDEKETVL